MGYLHNSWFKHKKDKWKGIRRVQKIWNILIHFKYKSSEKLINKYTNLTNIRTRNCEILDIYSVVLFKCIFFLVPKLLEPIIIIFVIVFLAG